MTNFWSLLLQIVPVLALALVIEVRVFVRQMARKKGSRFAASLPDRLIFVVSAVIVVAALLLCFSFALTAVNQGQDYPELRRAAMVGLSISFGFVVLSPIVAMCRALLADVPSRWRNWRAERDLDSEVNKLRLALNRAEKDLLATSLGVRGRLAVRYVEAYRSLHDLRRGGSQANTEQADLHAHLDDLDRWRADFDAMVANRQEGIRDAREHIRNRPAALTIDPALFRVFLKDLA